MLAATGKRHAMMWRAAIAFRNPLRVLETRKRTSEKDVAQTEGEIEALDLGALQGCKTADVWRVSSLLTDFST